VSGLGGLRAVAFDLDGTLVDSRLDLAAAVNRTRAALGLPPLALEAIVAMIGEGARNLVRRALGGAPEPELLERALARFLVEYEPICTERTRPYPGISELLGALRGRVRLAVLTNKPERSSLKILASCGWAEVFEQLLGGDTLAARKPDPGGLLELARRFGCAPREIALVGDSAIDAATAAAAGAPFVWAAWGFARPEERAALGAHPTATEAGEVSRLLFGG
jgi:phosphoglycolate phosphatase